MKKINYTNKKLIISIIVIIILIIISVFGYNFYQQQEVQKKIDNSITQIAKIGKDFTTKDNREDKLTLLKALLKEHEEYEKSKDTIDEVDKEYHKVIATIRKAFKEEYDNTLSGNTLKDVEKVSDKEQLRNAKSKLSDLLKIVQDEKNIVCLENDVKGYETSINELIKSYDERLTTIAQEEQQAEEARKEKENATVNQTQGNTNRDSNSSSSNGKGNTSDSNSNNSTSSNSNLPGASTHQGMSYETHYGYFSDDDSEGGIKYYNLLTWQNGDTYDLNTGEYAFNSYTDAW